MSNCLGPHSNGGWRARLSNLRNSRGGAKKVATFRRACRCGSMSLETAQLRRTRQFMALGLSS